jgi:hypothetical protein
MVLVIPSAGKILGCCKINANIVFGALADEKGDGKIRDHILLLILKRLASSSQAFCKHDTLCNRPGIS